ncbi:hypothetical protein ACH4RG_02830 [Streptomyces sp. NPDC021019]|uniref:hypothetical protein n=1 Tax=unclassified Streptomyces TaxID=2593676 RepID=UPI00379D54B7
MAASKRPTLVQWLAASTIRPNQLDHHGSVPLVLPLRTLTGAGSMEVVRMRHDAT